MTLSALHDALPLSDLSALLCDHEAATPLEPVWNVTLGSAFAGRARTVHAPEGGLDAVRRAAHELLPGEVLVVDASNAGGAVWGDTLGRVALERGAAGIVVDGYVRDTRALASLDLGIRAWRSFPRRALAHGSGSSDLEVEVAGAKVAPNDIVLADDDGVIVIRQSMLAIVEQNLQAWLTAERSAD